MGLDMYLRAKTTKRPYGGATGACGGLFNLAPEDDGMTEIGYWRKAYDQQALICDTIKSYTPADDNCVDFIITPKEIDVILTKANKALKSIEFDEEGGKADSDSYTWNSKNKWEDTIKFFEEAKKILEEDPEAEIYYCQWY